MSDSEILEVGSAIFLSSIVNGGKIGYPTFYYHLVSATLLVIHLTHLIDLGFY